MQCPEYRLRLFLSVDLVGSTAFKAKFGKPNLNSDTASPNPAWVDSIRHFYRDFPERVLRNYEKLNKASSPAPIAGVPQVWKTIGDEIVFCCKLTSREHLSQCVRAFIEALEQYGKYLDTKGKALDVKGYGWIAAFPSPNVTVAVFSPREITDSHDPSSLDFPDELTEKRADEQPGTYDFLGKEIDTGFRSGKHCSADRLSMSIELAWLVTGMNDQGHVKGFEYAYQGRQVLKGVLNDRPYPVISIDVERNVARKNVRLRERVINGGGQTPTAMLIHDFMESFLLDEGIEKPVLKDLEADETPSNFPESYQKYREDWTATAEEVNQRSKSEKASAAADDNSSNLVDDIIKKATDQLLERLKKFE